MLLPLGERTRLAVNGVMRPATLESIFMFIFVEFFWIQTPILGKSKVIDTLERYK